MSENDDRPQEGPEYIGPDRDLNAKLQQLQESEQKVAELEEKNAILEGKNEKLREVLQAARDEMLALREEIDRLGNPPSGYGVLVEVYEDGTVDVFTGGRTMRLTCSPNIDVSELRMGQKLRLNEALTIVEASGFARIGGLCTLKEVLYDESGDAQPRAVVVGHTGEDQVVWVADSIDLSLLKAGDTLLVSAKEGFVYERIPKSDAEQLVLEEVPDISYDDIGGLASQIEKIRDAVELPYLYADLFAEFQLRPPKGVLLYGPPGCGKTMIAKAVANSLAKKVRERTGREGGKAYFLNIKGPELLNKWVGETERQIREVFLRAREKASEGMPVIVFFDEMESLFRTRGSGVSSDMESTVVPQLLSEIDGVEGLENVIVIGASNREDKIDPAVLRPGRLDIKIKIERPDRQATEDIFSKYLRADLPIHPDDLRNFDGDVEACIKAMIHETVERMYREDDDNRFLEVTYANGDTEVLYFKDFNSGAMTENIVNRAKKFAIKDFIDSGQRGIRIQHLMDAVSDEFAENEDLPNTTNPDDWARISGKKGERIVYVRTLVNGGKSGGKGGPAPTTLGKENLGQYL